MKNMKKKVINKIKMSIFSTIYPFSLSNIFFAFSINSCVVNASFLARSSIPHSGQPPPLSNVCGVVINSPCFLHITRTGSNAPLYLTFE